MLLKFQGLQALQVCLPNRMIQITAGGEEQWDLRQEVTRRGSCTDLQLLARGNGRQPDRQSPAASLLPGGRAEFANYLQRISFSF